MGTKNKTTGVDPLRKDQTLDSFRSGPAGDSDRPLRLQVQYGRNFPSGPSTRPGIPHPPVSVATCHRSVEELPLPGAQRLLYGSSFSICLMRFAALFSSS